MKKIFLILNFVALMAIPSLTFAAFTVEEKVLRGVDLTIQGVFNLFMTLVCWFIQIVLVLMVAYIIYFGVMYLQSQGNATKVGEANKALGWGVVGVAVILGAYTIIYSVSEFVAPGSPCL